MSPTFRIHCYILYTAVICVYNVICDPMLSHGQLQELFSCFLNREHINMHSTTRKKAFG